MGLDNGFYLKSDKRNLTRDMLPKGMKYPFEKDYVEDGGIEFIYWRKCWGLRNEIINYLGGEEDKYEYTIDKADDLYDIMSIITKFMNERVWREEGNSIWSYDEMINIMRENLLSLAFVIAFMQENLDVYVVFYDSY